MSPVLVSELREPLVVLPDEEVCWERSAEKREQFFIDKQLKNNYDINIKLLIIGIFSSLLSSNLLSICAC